MIDLSKYPIKRVKLSQINGSDKRFMLRQKPDVEGMKKWLQRDKGQKTPVMLVEFPNTRFVILDGWTRYLSALDMGWEEIDAIIIPAADFADDDEMNHTAYTQNTSRTPLKTLDIAFYCQKLSLECKKANTQIAAIIGMSEKNVRRYLKVAKTSTEQQQAFLTGKTTIEQISGEGARRDAEATPQNGKISVKSIKTDFVVSVNYRVPMADPDGEKRLHAEITAAFKQAKIQKKGDKTQSKEDRQAMQAAKNAAIAALKTDEPQAARIETLLKAATDGIRAAKKAGKDPAQFQQLADTHAAELKTLKEAIARNRAIVKKAEQKTENREKVRKPENREKGLENRDSNHKDTDKKLTANPAVAPSSIVGEGEGAKPPQTVQPAAPIQPSTTKWKTVSGSADDQKDVPEEIKKRIDANKQAGIKGLEDQKQQALQQREQMIEQKKKLESGSDLAMEQALKTGGHKREDVIKQTDEAIKRLDDHIKKLDEEIKKLREGQ
jgi:ParB/RepB/Spo0J family partition protein